MFGHTLLAILIPFLATQASLAAPSLSPLEAVKRAEPHEVAALFRRAPNPSDSNWASNYPPTFNPPSGNQIPAAWLDRLRSITLPPVNRASGDGFPNYGGQNGGDSTVCSFTYGCTAPSDLKDPRAGWIGVTFDDGPAGGTDELSSFLQANNASTRATHFVIGSYILNNPGGLQKLAQAGGHLAVHTWSHKYMTTLSNEEIVGELGWTMQIISDLNGGRIPKYWRPPYGDVDNRVRAIAKGVFGLETVVWNHDTGDWNIGGNPQYTYESVSATFEGWLKGDKQYGLNILEHELNTNTIQVFKTAYPKMAANGWNVGSIPDAFGMDWYQNAKGRGNDGPVQSMIIGNLAATSGSSNNTGSASSDAASSSSSSSASSNSTAAQSSTVPPSSATASPTGTSSVSSIAAVATSSTTSAAKPLYAFSSLFALFGVALAILL